jgi:hypothetical protein
MNTSNQVMAWGEEITPLELQITNGGAITYAGFANAAAIGGLHGMAYGAITGAIIGGMGGTAAVPLLGTTVGGAGGFLIGGIGGGFFGFISGGVLYLVRDGFSIE